MITERNFELEQRRLTEVIKLLLDKLAKYEGEINISTQKLLEFKKYSWENRQQMDNQELGIADYEMGLSISETKKKREYYQKLFKIKGNPYFASIIFEDELGERFSVYLGLTYLKDDDYGNIIYDWRSPIASLFYDYEVGKCTYLAPAGPVSGTLIRKRQYKIVSGKLIGAFDNSLNINDELLQEVLASSSSDKMRNIVNTIQQEQNAVIRNIKDKTLIVSGIAGSGKTSVALHRIAYLLYKIKNLQNTNVLIFSPNQIFTEYISNVLPELGEKNTLQTTFSEYLKSSITEYTEIETFMDFIGNYYALHDTNFDLLSYKQSDDIIADINCYIEDYIKKAKVINDFVDDKTTISSDLINSYLTDRYANLPFFARIDEIAENLSAQNNKGSIKKKNTYLKQIYSNSNFTNDFKDIYLNFYSSDFTKYRLNNNEIKELKSNKIPYADALLFTYMKSLLQGFGYEKDIRHVVIDEAQDYNRLEFLIISKIFKNASFTILGDVNQTINPYYKYASLNTLSDLFEKVNCISLNKTYRSSPEIIEFTNRILNLQHVCAIRTSENIPLVHRTDYSYLPKDIAYLHQKYQSLAIITRENETASRLYEKLKDSFNVSLLNNNIESFDKSIVIMPAYLAKGLEFDSVIVYSDEQSKYLKNEKNLLYVACTRAQHELIVYSQK